MEIVICEECKATNKESEVKVFTQHTKPVPQNVYYDKSGIKHMHNPDIVIASYVCSLGHVWYVMNYSNCPNPACNWSSKELVR